MYHRIGKVEPLWPVRVCATLSTARAQDAHEPDALWLRAASTSAESPTEKIADRRAEAELGLVLFGAVFRGGSEDEQPGLILVHP